MAWHYPCRMLVAPWPLDLPSITRILCMHRSFSVERSGCSQVSRILPWRFLRHGIPDPVLLGELNAQRELRRERSHHLINDDAGVLQSNLDSTVHLPYSRGAAVSEWISCRNRVSVHNVGDSDGRCLVYASMEGQEP